MSNLTTEVDNLISELCTDDGYVHNNIEGGQGNHFHSIKINQLVDIIDKLNDAKKRRFRTVYKSYQICN